MRALELDKLGKELEKERLLVQRPELQIHTKLIKYL